MAAHMSPFHYDAWFDLVPLALIEFNEHGRVLRANSALSATLGYATPAGTHLADCPPAMQRLCGWDAPLTLLTLGPEDPPLHAHVIQPRHQGSAAKLCSQVWAQAESDSSQPTRFLCAIKEHSVQAEDVEATAHITSDADAAPVPEMGQLLHELSTILESTPAGIAYLRNGRLVRCNQRFERMLGLMPGSIVGQGIVALEGLDPRIDQLISEVSASIRTQGHYESEIELSKPGELARWYALSVRLIGPGPQPSETIAVLTDITHTRSQQAQLEALGRDRNLQADRMRAILDSVFVGIVTLDDRGIAWMNQSARRMFAGNLSDFLGHPLSTVATPDLDHPFRLTDYLDDLRDGQSHTFECQVVGRDGRVFWVVGNAVVTYGEANQRHVTYALLDIDRRREAEAQSAEAQATLQRIIEMAPMAIHLVDARNLHLIQANQTAAEFMAVDLHTAIGQPPEVLYGPERGKLLRADMQAALNEAHMVHREYKVPSKTNGHLVWDVNYLPLVGDDDNTDQLLIVATDVTAQRAAEQARLEAAIAQREMLVREVHHRIKNNLQGVAGLLQQIAARKPEVAPAIAEVVGQVQAIAQVYGLQVGSGGPLRLRSVVDAIASSVQRTFGRTISVLVDGAHVDDWQLPEAESIPIALSLNELLTNALKHGPGSTPIQCTVQANDTAVRINIRNPGYLKEGFSVDRVPGGVSGLGLVRALLPRRSARLTVTQDGAYVLTSVDLAPPGIKLAPPQQTQAQHESTGRQTTLWPQ
ncbi:PAS domain S-box protein [Aquabacterium sp.]|uniref:sensor histidine kinase n=1 Tax=Aquabacterium sp. TaxID=1872578 RepID=UPI003B6FA2D2